MEKLFNKKQLASKTMGVESDPTGKLMQRSQKSMKFELMEKVNDVKEMIDRHKEQIHWNVTKNARETIAFIRMMQKKNFATEKPKSATIVPKAKGTNSLSGLLEVWKLLRAPQIAISNEQNDLNSDDSEGAVDENRVSLHSW